jgi:hypothetical protein
VNDADVHCGVPADVNVTTLLDCVQVGDDTDTPPPEYPVPDTSLAVTHCDPDPLYADNACVVTVLSGVPEFPYRATLNASVDGFTAFDPIDRVYQANTLEADHDISYPLSLSGRAEE